MWPNTTSALKQALGYNSRGFVFFGGECFHGYGSVSRQMTFRIGG